MRKPREKGLDSTGQSFMEQAEKVIEYFRVEHSEGCIKLYSAARKIATLRKKCNGVNLYLACYKPESTTLPQDAKERITYFGRGSFYLKTDDANLAARALLAHWRDLEKREEEMRKARSERAKVARARRISE